MQLKLYNIPEAIQIQQLSHFFDHLLPEVFVEICSYSVVEDRYLIEVNGECEFTI